MALKPFYNKKGHLGMTRQQVKDALKVGGSLQFYKVSIPDEIGPDGGYSIHERILSVKTYEDTEAYSGFFPNPIIITLSDDQLLGLLSENPYSVVHHIPLNEISEEFIGIITTDNDFTSLLIPVYIKGSYLLTPFLLESLVSTTGIRYILLNMYGFGNYTIFIKIEVSGDNTLDFVITNSL